MSTKVFGDVISLCAGSHRVLAIDWRGHGESPHPSTDFGYLELVDDSVSVVDASGLYEVIPVAMANAGWVAIELSRRLGARVPKIILLDWFMGEASPTFLNVLDALQNEDTWHATVTCMFECSLARVRNSGLETLIRREIEMHGFDMWSRAAREIAAAYRHQGSPLKALTSLQHHVEVLHLCAQPDSAELDEMQYEFQLINPWFSFERLMARTHFPTLEIGSAIAAAVSSYAACGVTVGRRSLSDNC